MPAKVATVKLWKSTIGAVSWDEQRQLAAFEYTPEFQGSRIELAPLTMPLGPTIYMFPELSRDSFFGLPGMLADCLPDKFGNLLIDRWLVQNNRPPSSFSPIERLCYVGCRGMGALEFHPANHPDAEHSVTADIETLVELASEALSKKEQLKTQIPGKDEADLEAMKAILRVGTSAGGARAKAVIAWDEDSGEVRSGQVQAPAGFTYWLLKFDGLKENRDKELNDPQGFGLIEYAYHQMAVAAGIEMTRCRILEENGRHHFMTKRFDRTDDGAKIHMQSLCALAHYDYNLAGAYSYEQALQVCLELELPHAQLEQLFRRAVFNIMARNQDDHTKNIAFLMHKNGAWELSPAYDVTYSYNPLGEWTSQHQMSLHGKRDRFTLEDIRTVAKSFRLFRGSQLDEMLQQIDDAIGNWEHIAQATKIDRKQAEAIGATHRRLDQLASE